MGYLGLAITSSVTLILNAFFLFCGVIHSGVRLAIKPVLVECSILVAASLVFAYLVSAYSENNVMQVFSLLKPLIKGVWPLSYDLVGNKIIDLLKLIYGFVLLIFLFGGAAFLYFKRFNPKENV
jgi:hypothetical protein